MSKLLDCVSFRIQQFQTSARLEGWPATFRKVILFLSHRILPKKILKIKISQKLIVKDILFINGCALDQCRRYRVLHPIEQLESLGLSCEEKWYENIQLQDLKYYRGFIFYRTPVTETIRKFIQLGKELNKTFFFDIDDLVIDLRYTQNHPYLNSLPSSEKALYDEGVVRMQETLKLCDVAITTTPTLAKELHQWKKNVFINPNVASDQMLFLAESAYEKREKLKDRFVIGYLSGSITHNSDFEIIVPALVEFLKKNSHAILKIVGLIEVPPELQELGKQLEISPLVKWDQLPSLLTQLDLNLAPLQDSLFNRAKSENRWMEAAWLRIPTLASRVGRLEEVIHHGKDGWLVSNSPQEWLNALEYLAKSAQERIQLGENSYLRVRKEYHTLKTGLKFKNFILDNLRPNYGFVLPMVEPRGGILVVIQHAKVLKKNGIDVTLFSTSQQNEDYHDPDCGTLPVISLKKTDLEVHFDQLVATLWATADKTLRYSQVKRKSYLVQGYEVDFNLPPHFLRRKARATYQLYNLDYLTISRWCENWLKSDYDIHARYAPNGINLNLFQNHPRDFSTKKWKILIEGNAIDRNKNVDESFKIIEKLRAQFQNDFASQFEIWFLSNDGKPKSWYSYDRLFRKMPYNEVAKIYQQCHVLLKSSGFESFSYPPLEMMATGGLVVVRANDGNREYLIHEKNCLLYEGTDWEKAAHWITRLKEEKDLRQILLQGGLDTAKSRDWKTIEDKIYKLYLGEPRNSAIKNSD